MTPYTKADKNIRMKKILNILIVMLALFNSTVQAGTVTRTIWEENCDLGSGKTSIDDFLFSDIYAYDAYMVESEGADPDYNFADDYVHAAPGEKAMPGSSDKGILTIDGYDDVYMHINFDYDKTIKRDNWTVSVDVRSFDAYQHTLGFPRQFCFTGTKVNLPSKEDLTSAGTYLVLNKLEDHNDTGGQYAIYEIILGGISTGKTFRMNNSELYNFRIKCTNANTNNATLTFIINNSEIVSENVNPESIGAINGIFASFYNTLEESQFISILNLDNFLLTTDVEVDDTPCSEPEYTITGAYDKDRMFTLTCPTDGAKIYWSESQLAAGAEGWNEYTGEVQTSTNTIYAYAYNSENETSSQVISFETGAGIEKIKIPLPDIIKTSYDSEQGYAFSVVPNYEGIAVAPKTPIIYYSIDGGSVTQIAPGETAYVTPGSVVRAYITADGYTKSGTAMMQTSARPQAPRIWTQDFTTLVDANTYGTDKKNIVLGSSAAFSVETKPIYSIKQFTNNSQNISVNVNNNLGLTSSTYYYLQAGKGIISTKPVNNEISEDNDETSYLDEADGIGINGLGDGQYIFVETDGDEVSITSGGTYLSGASTIYEHIFRASASTVLLDIPEGVNVKGITICSNFETVTTDANGYALHVSRNPLDFSNCDARTFVFDSEIRSGVFTDKDIAEVPAGEPFILKGTANTTYNISLGTASIMQENNLLTVSNSDIKVSDYSKPIYVFDSNEGKLVLADNNATITAGTPYYLSPLDVAEYYDLTLDETGKIAVVYNKPLDFSDVGNLKAYIVTSESLQNGFEFTPVESIPAETGIILVGDPNETYHIQVGTNTEKITNNKLKGSSSVDFNTASTDSLVYVLSTTSNTLALEVIDKNAVPTIKAGTAYLRSKYKGFVQIRTNASGTASLTSDKSLSFTEVALRPYIITGESETGIITRNESEIPAGTAFYVTGGVADSTYTIPVVTVSGTLADNKLISSQTNFNVSDTPNYVYALNATTGNFERMPEEYVVPAGEAYFISQYERIIDLGCVQIKTNENGVATYITQNALDFSSIELRAYIGISESTYGTIEKMEIEQAPAGTPIFVRGTANTIYEVPIIAGTTTNVTANKLQGSLTEDFNVINQDYFVYVVKQNSSDFVKAEPSYVVPAGEAYYISSKIGVERIKTGVAGATTWVTSHPLDFSSFEDLSVLVVKDETPTEIITQKVSEVPTDCPIVLRGEPNTTYVVPVGTCVNLGYENKLLGYHDKPFPVSDAWGKVYVISAKTGKFTVASKTLTIPAGKAFFVSEYNGTEAITTNEYGYTSWVSDNPLDFETVKGVTVSVVKSETFDSIFIDNTVKRLPEGSAFIIKGEPNTTYNVPIRQCVQTVDNILKGSTTDTYKVSDWNANVYVINKQGVFTVAAKTLEIPARKAYILSAYRGSEEVEINSTGKITYISKHPLDFYETKDLRAFIVTEETQDSIYTKQVKEVPAGEPILLYGEPGKKYRIPIGTCEELNDGLENRLSGSLTEDFEVSSVEPYMVYVLSATDGKFTVASSSLTIPAGKAYLISKFTSTTASAKGISSFIGEEDEDETTAIKQIDSTNNDGSHRFFNLAGQPVDEDYKGIVIDEKGKKYYRK